MKVSITTGSKISCSHGLECISFNTARCKTCKHNHVRNKRFDYYEAAGDNCIPDHCPYLTYDGPAEQTAGYKCPVCGEYTNPYALGPDKLCKHCGYELNVG